MCTYSMVVSDWHHPTWPIHPGDVPATPSPNSIPWPTVQHDPALAQQMLEVLRRLEDIDKRLQKIECICTDDEKRRLREELQKIADQAKRAVE